MGPEEGERLAALLKALSRDHALLLIEHDMDVVFAVADTLDRDGGRPRAGTGPPAAHPRLRRGARRLSGARRVTDARRPSWKRAASSPATAPGWCCAASTSLVRPGEAIGLMGRNGMGKTTLIRTLMGQVPARAGAVLVDGRG